MAAHTKIIDLFGLPACGKSTLIIYLKNLNENDLVIGSLRDVRNDAKSHLLRYITCISIKIWIATMRLWLSIPREKIRKEISFKEWLLFGIDLVYARRHTNYDIVLNDPGVIQKLVSLEGGENLHELDSFRNAASNFIDVVELSRFIYCDIDAVISFKRMKNRNRSNGRIDIISDGNKQLNELVEEKKRFVFLSNILYKKGLSPYKLCMDGETSEIAEELLKEVGY